MDVRCERCRAEYVIADEDVGDEGLAVRCAGCGHVFRVKRKAFVVTVPVKPEELGQVAPVSIADLDRRHRNAPTLANAPVGEGPVVAGDLGRVAEDRWEAGQGRPKGDEPAWAAPGSAPSAPERPERRREREQRSFWPKLVFVALVLAAGAAVVIGRPQWLGLGPVVLPGVERAPNPMTTKPAAAAPSPATPASIPAPAPNPTPTSPATASPPPIPAAAEPKPTPLPGPLPASRGEGDETRRTQEPSPPPGERGGSAASTAPAAETSDRAGKSSAVSATPPAPAKPPKRLGSAEKPSGSKALIAEGRRLRDRGRPQEALDVYARALSAASDDADALAGRGLCYLDLSRYRPAESSFEEALRADATHPDALMGLAETYRYEGRRAEAVTYYQRYLAAHPKGRDAAAARSAVEALKE